MLEACARAQPEDFGLTESNRGSDRGSETAPSQGKASPSLKQRCETAVMTTSVAELICGTAGSAEAKKTYNALFGHVYRSEVLPYEVTEEALPAFVAALVDQLTVAMRANTERGQAAVNKRYAADKEKAEKANKPFDTVCPTYVPPKLAVVAHAAAAGLHTHQGKLVDSGAQVSLWRPLAAAGERVPYLSSRVGDARRVRWFSFRCNQLSLTSLCSIFQLAFRYRGRVTCLGERILEEDEAVLKALASCMTAEDAADLLSAFERAPAEARGADSRLPLLRWPVDAANDHYHSLQAVPSVAVINMISHIAHISGRPQLSRVVGGGQPQNVSIFASSIAGKMPMLQCVPPFIKETAQSRILQLVLSNKLVVRGPQREPAFESSLEGRPRGQRLRFLRGFADSHAAKALWPLNALRDAFEDADARLAEAVSTLPIHLQRYAQSLPLSEEQLDDLVGSVKNAVPFSSLSCHAPSDQLEYLEILREAVSRHEAGVA